MKATILAAAVTCAFAITASAEVILYNFTARQLVIGHGNERTVRHSGQLILDFDTGQGYQVGTWRIDGHHYVGAGAVTNIEYFRGIGQRNYTLIRSGENVGFGREVWLDLSPVLSAPLPRTFQTVGRHIAGTDDLNSDYSSFEATYSFDKRRTQYSNINGLPADLLVLAFRQNYIDRGYTPTN